MAWRVARSLDTLLDQLNAMAPRRSKKSDGSIGDAAHATRDSDHNPWLSLAGTGVVTARDFTNDPAGGLDCDWLAKVLVSSGDPRIKYVIWNRRIWSPGKGWKAYTGSNPHDHHLHLSVSSQPGWFDSTLPWALGSGTVGSPVTTLPASPAPAQEVEDDMFSETRDRATIENTAYLVGQIKEQTDRLYDEDVQTDQLVWGLLDPDSGLRVQVASLQGQLAALTTAVQQLGLGGGGLDMAVLSDVADRAASKAAAEALGGLADKLRPAV